MTRSAARTRIAGGSHFGDGGQSASLYFTFDGALRNEEAGANQCFVARPIIASGVAVFANRGEQRVAGECGTVFVIRYYAK